MNSARSFRNYSRGERDGALSKSRRVLVRLADRGRLFRVRVRRSSFERRGSDEASDFLIDAYH